MLIVVIAAASAFAGVTAGAIAQWNGTLGSAMHDITNNEDGSINWERAKEAALDPAAWQFGAEVRTSIAIAEIDAAALFSKADAGMIINGYLTAGINIDLFIAKLGLTIGPDVTYFTDPADATALGKPQLMIGTMDQAQQDRYDDYVADYQAKNDGETPDDLLATFLTAPLNLKATADFVLGPVVVGASLVLPVNVSFYGMDIKDLIPKAEDLMRCKVGLSAGIKLF